MSTESATATLLHSYDIRLDSNNTWDEPKRTYQIEVYPVHIDADGILTTDMMDCLVEAEAPNHEGKCEDVWYSSEETHVLGKLPEALRVTVLRLLEEARNKQVDTATERAYALGQTVFLPEYKFPAEVQHFTTDGRYVLNMANSGELEVFAEDEISPYSADKWEA